jgi:sarcosine oxidase
LAGGAWTASLVPELRPALTIERQVLAWFEPSELVAYDLQHFPIYCYEFTPGRINFGVGRTFRGVKAGIHHSGDHIERPEDASRAVGEAEVQRLRDTLRPVLPGLARARLRETQVCLYTNTPDQHFLVDWHPRHANVLVSSPCSGHGFKFASVLGEAQADLLTTGKSLFDLSPFGFSRLVSA